MDGSADQEMNRTAEDLWHHHAFAVHNNPTCRRNVQQNSGKTGILDQYGNATIFGLKIRFRARDISHGYAILSPAILVD
jgi:hypothetical protein